MRKILFAGIIAILMIGSVFALIGVGPIVGPSESEEQAIEITAQDLTREGLLPFDKNLSNFYLLRETWPSTLTIGTKAQIDVYIGNKENKPGAMYVQCSILDKTVVDPGDVWLRQDLIGRSASIIPMSANCVPNEPYTKTVWVSLGSGERAKYTFSIPVPAYPTDHDVRIYCNTFERCSDEGDSYGTSTLTSSVKLVKGTADCTENQVRCASGSTTKREICKSGKWVAHTECSSTQECKPSNGGCAPKCVNQCDANQIKCETPSTYYACTKDANGCNVWKTTSTRVTEGSICQNNAIVPIVGPEIKIPCYVCTETGWQNQMVSTDDLAYNEAVPAPSLFDRLFGMFGRAETPQPPLCENKIGYYTKNRANCERGDVIPDITNFKPRVVELKAKDCKTGAWVLPGVADLSCYTPGSNMPVYVEIVNDASVPSNQMQATTLQGRIAGWVLDQYLYYNSQAEKDAIWGTYLYVRDAVFNYMLNTDKIKLAGGYNEYIFQHNQNIIDNDPNLMDARIEIGIYAPNPAKEYLGSRASDTMMQELTRKIAPSCKDTNGVNEAALKYVKSFSVIMLPKIDNECKFTWGELYAPSVNLYNGACRFKMVVDLKVPESEQITIGGEKMSNFNADGEYILAARVFDRCYTDAMARGETRETVSFGGDKDVRVQLPKADSVCCAVSGKYSTMTPTACTSAGGESVAMSSCTGGVVGATVCYRCLAEGPDPFEFTSMVEKPVCGRIGPDYDASTYKWTDENKDDECYIDPPEDPVTCWGCINSNLRSLERATGTCGVGDFEDYPYTPENTPKTCGGPNTYKQCYHCDGSETAQWPFLTSIKCSTTDFELEESEWVMNNRCQDVDVTSFNIQLDPDNKDNYCLVLKGESIENGCTRGSYPRKNLMDITLSEEEIQNSPEIPWYSNKVDRKIAIMEDEEYPLCFAKGDGVRVSGKDYMCKDGGICMPAKKDGDDNSQKIYNIIIEENIANPLQFSEGLIPGVLNLGAKAISWIFSTGEKPTQDMIEQYGLCVYEKQGFLDTFQRWFAETFGLDMEGKYFNYYFYGAIAAIVIILFLVLSPRQPRPNQGGGF